MVSFHEVSAPKPCLHFSYRDAFSYDKHLVIYFRDPSRRALLFVGDFRYVYLIQNNLRIRTDFVGNLQARMFSECYMGADGRAEVRQLAPRKNANPPKHHTLLYL